MRIRKHLAPVFFLGLAGCQPDWRSIEQDYYYVRKAGNVEMAAEIAQTCAGFTTNSNYDRLGAQFPSTTARAEKIADYIDAYKQVIPPASQASCAFADYEIARQSEIAYLITPR